MADKSSAYGGLRELALFAGAGGGILGGHLLGWRTVCAVECDPYAASVLVARQNDGHLPPFPVWDDVCTFDGNPWRGIVDVVSGGFPCQDISVAGKRAGIAGERSGLWSEMSRIIGKVRPRWVFVENSPNLLNCGIEVVLEDLSALGFDAQWCRISAMDVGAPHKRDRLWIVANATQLFGDGGTDHADVGVEIEPLSELRDRGGATHLGDTNGAGLAERQDRAKDDRAPGECEFLSTQRTSWWVSEPGLGRMADGVANEMDIIGADDK